MRYNKPVLMTLMCQHNISTGLWVDAKLVMRWLRCSKPTALDVLNELTVAGYLERMTTVHRPNARKYFWRPKKSIFDKYRRGEYREAYLTYMSGF